MSADITRFLHASDFDLSTPMFGVAGLPTDLRQTMATARYRAAQRVFDVAVSEDVDFVVLSGGILGDIAADSRSAWFFANQCERLSARQTPVYWIEEAGAIAQWADYVPLPSNVYQGDPALGQQFLFETGRRARVRIIAGSDRRRESDDDEATICVLPGGLEDQPLSAAGVDYWALGSRGAPGAVPAACGLAQFAGSPQGRTPSDPGPRGCQLVTIDGEKIVRSNLKTTDVVRWHEERVQVSEDADWDRLCQLLLTRKQHLARLADAEVVMVRWSLYGHGPLWEQLLREELCERLVNTLRDRTNSPGAQIWSLVVEPVPDQEEMDFWKQFEAPFSETGAERQAHEPLAGPHFPTSIRPRVVREAARVLADQK